jgi:hypothetical protein
MSKASKFIVFSLALCLFIFSAAPSFAQWSKPDFDADYFRTAPPITDAEVLYVIKISPQLKQEFFSQDDFQKLANAKGMTPERLNLAIIKVTFGMMLELDPSSRQQAVEISGTEYALPTETELRVIRPHLDELIEVFS